MKKTITNVLKFLLFAGVGVTILYFVYQQQQANLLAKCAVDNIPTEQCSLMDKLIEDFRSLNYWWILAVIVAFSFSNLSRAIRWGMLVKPLSHQPRLANTFLTVIIGYMANMALPRVGEIVRGATLAKHENIPVEKVMGTIVLDRLMDVLFLIIAVGLAFIIEFDTLLNFLQKNLPEDWSIFNLFKSPIFIGILSVMVIAAIAVLAAWEKVKQTKIYLKVRKVITGFAEGLQTIRQLDRPWLFLFHSTNVWVMYYIMNYVCFYSFAPTAMLTPEAGLMVFVFGAFGIVIPSPGGMGSFHWLAIQALALYGIDSNDAFSYANVIYITIQIVYNVFLGLIAFSIIGWINRNYHPQANANSNDSLATH